MTVLSVSMSTPILFGLFLGKCPVNVGVLTLMTYFSDGDVCAAESNLHSAPGHASDDEDVHATGVI
ncbi:uncharacterized protein V1513DRAFT_422949 [Lipomyces chichibuensis]|uniref:uncharacterized protein n=1 Tax=Lipomyces chichibuensis TaxID=1546026 RepID=UPI0033430003